MSKEALLTKEQALLLKKKKPTKRTKERFKYVNAAVAQGAILGLDKLVFVTMCEFADDAGWLWHGERSLATATGLSQSTVHRCIERLIDQGAVKLLHRGKSKWDTNLYKVSEIDTETATTIYKLVKFQRLQKQAKTKQPLLEPILCEAVSKLTDSIRIGEVGELILCESKDIEFDLDSSIFISKIGELFRSNTKTADLKERLKSQDQNQSQNRKASGLKDASSRCSSSETTNSLPETRAEKKEAKTNTNSNTSPRYAPRYVPPVLVAECEDCFQPVDNHHKNCKLLREAHHA